MVKKYWKTPRADNFCIGISSPLDFQLPPLSSQGRGQRGKLNPKSKGLHGPTDFPLDKNLIITHCFSFTYPFGIDFAHLEKQRFQGLGILWVKKVIFREIPSNIVVILRGGAGKKSS